MSHLLLAEKHQQLLLNNTESQPAREVHTTTTQPAATAEIKVEAHAAEASRRPPRGSYRKSQPSHMARVMCIRDVTREMTMQREINLGPESTSSNLGTFDPDNFKVIVTSVGVRQ